MKLWVLFAGVFFVVRSLLAIDVEVENGKEFIIVEQKDGITIMSTWAIRKSHISSVQVERSSRDYGIVIVTTAKEGSEAGPVVKQYATRTGDKSKMFSAFRHIMKSLGENVQ